VRGHSTFPSLRRGWTRRRHVVSRWTTTPLSDEDVDLARDQASRILGRHALSALPDVANERGLGSADIRAIAENDQRLNELLAVLQDKRRPGFERQPRTHPHPGDREEEHPEALLVMAEYAVGDPVWNRSPGHGGLVNLADLSISETLQRSLRLWNETYERVPRPDGAANKLRPHGYRTD
jgi:hypothetical protein